MEKNILLILLIFFCSINFTQAQFFEMDDIDGLTTNICQGVLYDSGGEFGFYANNESFSTTFCPDASDLSLNLTPTQFDVSAPDFLCIYDGVDNSAPLIGCFNNDNPLGIVLAGASNVSGCLHLEFTSDGAGTSQGWALGLSCTAPCQQVVATLTSSTPAADPPGNGYIDICPGETVFLNGAGQYPENNLLYSQSDLTTEFFWNFGDNVNALGVGPSTAYTYDDPGGYIVQLYLTDVEGCENQNRIDQRIRVAPPIEFNDVTISEETICLGETVTLSASNSTSSTGSFLPPSVRSDSLFIPDGTGQAYEAGIEFDAFAPGAVLTDINDILNICVNIEHSFMRDLQIWIECPNGTQVELLNHVQLGLEVFLGIPNENDGPAGSGSDQNPPGQGADYCWSPTSTIGTWLEYANANNDNLTPGLEYESFESLNNLLGCPLNGEWNLIIRDNWGTDNGTIFSWEINFNPNLFPALETFTPVIESEGWASDPSVITTMGNTITAMPACPGTASYTLTATNDYGCTYDTTLNVTVLPAGDAACFSCSNIAIDDLDPETICEGDNVTLMPSVFGADGSIVLCNPAEQAIPDNSVSTGNPLNATIDVSGIAGNVSLGSVQEVCLDIDHGFDGDLDIYLVAPGGQILELSTDNGGGGDDFIGTCFTISAINSITTGSAPFTGAFLPEGDWNTLNGSPMNGTWTLRIFDDGNGFAGSLQGWSITLANPYNVDYSWSPATGLSCTDCPTPIADPLVTTIYSVTATDNNGCTGTGTLTVNVDPEIPGPPLSCGTSTINSVTFNWTGSSTYEVSLDGGTTWIPPNNGALSHTETGLVTGQMVTILVQSTSSCAGPPTTITCSANNCIPYTSNVVVTDVLCNGGSDGAITLNMGGAVPPFTYQWTGGIGNIDNPTGLVAGSYSVTVTDTENCTFIQNSIMVNEPNALQLTFSESPVSCFGDTNGSASVSVMGGTAPYNYLWDASAANQATSTAINLGEGNYTVTVTDDNNCQLIGTVDVTEPTQLTTTLSSTDLTCNMSSDGTVSSTTTGGTAPYTYVWSGTTQTDGNITGLNANTYDVTITDANSCEVTATTVITEPLAIVLSTTTNPASCNGGTDGDATVNITNGIAPFTFLWDAAAGNQATQTAINLPFGNYTVTVTDANGCTDNIVANVGEQSSVTYTISGSTLNCFGDADGTVSVNVTAGVAPFTYLWDNGQTTDIATGLIAGNYTITISDANGCSSVDNTDVLSPNEIIPVLTGTDALCNGENSGSISSVTTGGTGAYSYVWSNGQTTMDATGLIAGTYDLTVTDINGCVGTASIAISEPALLTSSISGTAISCFGGQDGTATVVESGGTPNYTYQWDTNANNQNTSTATNLSAGTYVVTITDNNGCTNTNSVTLTEPATAVSISLVGQDISCNGGSDGNIVSTTAGGTPGYTYLWDVNTNSQTTANATGLTLGTYFVTVTDNNGCTATASTSLNEPVFLSNTLSATPESCFGNDGTATVVAAGGTMPYVYSWSPTGQTNATATGLAEGNYIILITDANSCTSTGTIAVGGPTAITLVTDSTAVSCNGGMDGTATISATGGSGGFTYLWDVNAGSQTNPIATGLVAGTYNVTATDLNGCTEETFVIVTEPTPVVLVTSTSPVSCFGGSDGTATISASGGTETFTYQWDAATGNQATSIAFDLASGTYVVTVTDGNNCEATASVTISEPAAALNTSISGTNLLCNGDTNGTATVIVSGGTPGYTYEWSDPSAQTNATAINLTAGNYSVTITDINGCRISDNVNLTEPSDITVITTQTASGCFGGADGSATAVGSGGTIAVDYAFTWSNGQTGATATGLVGGSNYVVTVTDDNGCQQTDNIVIGQPAPIQLPISFTDVSCFTGNDGTAVVNPFGGTPPYNYTWSDGQLSQTATGLSVGTYQVSVVDVFGCGSSVSVEIGQPTPMNFQYDSEEVLCYGDSTGSAVVIVTGGTPPYTYAWSDYDNQTTANIDTVAAGIYQVSVTDNNGCLSIGSVEVIQPSAPLGADISPIDIPCFDGTNGQIEVYGTGGTGPYTYSVDGDYYNGSNLIIGLEPNDYVVYVQDSRGCLYESSATVEEPEEFLVDVGPDITIEYGDSVNLEAITNIIGAHEYSWTSESPIGSLSCIDCFNPVSTPEYDITYFVEVISENGCIAEDQITIRVNKVDRVFVANAFTPNGDGANDWFFVQGGRGTEIVRKFRVYDRWGEHVFEARDVPLNQPDAGWDGTLNGKDMNPAVFAWYAEIEFSDGRIELYKGNVTLLR